MIFILHYILFNAGLPATTVLMTLFLQTYSNASLTEIGTLLMVLPFLSIIVKPLFCALADRQQAHKYYLAGANICLLLGYGSLTIAPFFPQFIKDNGRLIWYTDIVGIVFGFSALGVLWSLGDALAVNAARRRGVPWGAYRAWATFSWGVFGYIVGLINETPALPKYTPAFFILIAACAIEIVLVLLWPNADFDMDVEGPQAVPQNEQQDAKSKPTADDSHCSNREADEYGYWPASTNQSLRGTLNSGSARMNPRLVNAMASILAEDLGSSLKSSLKLGSGPKRAALDDLLEQHQLKQAQQQAANQTPEPLPTLTNQAPSTPAKSPLNGIASNQNNSPASEASMRSVSLQRQASGLSSSFKQMGSAAQATNHGGTLTKAMLLRTQRALSRMNSLSSATGHAILDLDQQNQFDFESPESGGKAPQQMMMILGHQYQKPMVMSSLASNASLSRAAAARALGFSGANSTLNNSALSSAKNHQQESPLALDQHSQLSANEEDFKAATSTAKSIEDLQLILLKLIVKKDPSIYKYFILFTLFGFLLFVHNAFFFLHVERLCRDQGYDFSNVMGTLIVSQSISEIFTFLVVVKFYCPRVGRIGSMITCILVFFIRYTYYGTYYQYASPYSAIFTETCHGLAYGITYTLITDVAVDCVNQVDVYLPELIQRKLVDPSINPNILKLPLRATMQGVFSGAFDGLGNGIGCLFAGIFLDKYSFVSLWMVCSICSAVIGVLYPLTEYKALFRRRASEPKLSLQVVADHKSATTKKI